MQDSRIAEREELIEELSASLDATDLGEYWEAEIKRRRDDVDAGRVKTVPAEEVCARPATDGPSCTLCQDTATWQVMQKMLD